MNRATICIPRILKHEGGYVNHPNDPGGPTNKGITLATFRRYLKRNGTIDDLKALTTEQATAVYKAQYWDAVSADLLPVGVDYAGPILPSCATPKTPCRTLAARAGPLLTA